MKIFDEETNVRQCIDCPNSEEIKDKSFKRCKLTKSLIMSEQLYEIAYNCPLMDNEDVCDVCGGYASLGKVVSPYNEALGGMPLERYYCSECYNSEKKEI